MALAAVFAGEIPLPSRQDMRREYSERLRRKGAGRSFHSLKEDGQEIAYVNELADMVNRYRSALVLPMPRHTERWHEAYLRRLQKRDKIFATPVGQWEQPQLDELIVEC